MGKKIQVVATGVGFYNATMYQPGDNFSMDEDILDGKKDAKGNVVPATWVERFDAKKVKAVAERDVNAERTAVAEARGKAAAGLV